jgi:hypothetical protein
MLVDTVSNVSYQSHREHFLSNLLISIIIAIKGLCIYVFNLNILNLIALAIRIVFYELITHFVIVLQCKIKINILFYFLNFINISNELQTNNFILINLILHFI